MNRTIARVAVALLATVLVALPAAGLADEAPIVGTVKAVDGGAKTLTVEAAAKGKVRQVVIDIRPTTKIVRFVREGGSGAFKEQAATLAELKPGWTVSVTTKHEGTREVAELVRVVHEK